MNWLSYYIINAVIALNATGLYIPPCTDFPMLTSKNEIRVDAGFKLFEVQAAAAYALTDDLLVQIDADAGGLFGYDRRSGQVAMGWYKNMDSHAVVEVLGGASVGLSNHNQSASSGACFQGRYTTLFLQGDYGWTNLANSHIDLAFGMKCGLLNCYLVDNGFNPRSTDIFYSTLFAEPNICFRFGWEKFKFNMMMGYNFHRIDESSKNVISNVLSTNISLNYHFAPKKKGAANAAHATL